MGEFVAFLSELEGEKKGVLEYDPAASCYWKPIYDLSQEELTLFLGAKNCAEKNSILKRFAKKLYSPELIVVSIPKMNFLPKKFSLIRYFLIFNTFAP